MSVKEHKVDCIWFKSLDCGGTLALLNTHCSCSYSVAQRSTHSKTNALTRLPSLNSNSFMTHIAPAIRLAPNKHNKQRRKYIPLPSLLYKWKLKQLLTCLHLWTAVGTISGLLSINMVHIG